jgi:hypothetical protein
LKQTSHLDRHDVREDRRDRKNGVEVPLLKLDADLRSKQAIIEAATVHKLESARLKGSFWTQHEGAINQLSERVEKLEGATSRS